MKNNIFWMFVLILLATPASAQDWQRGSMGNVEYNCDAVNGAVADYGDELYVIRGADSLIPEGGAEEHYVLAGVDMVTVAESMLGRAPGCGTASETNERIVDIYDPHAWQPNITHDYLYQCDVARAIAADYGDLEFRRDGDRHHTVLSFFQEDAPDCVPPYVTTTVYADIFACASSDCEKTDRIMRWLAWKVVGLSDGWYEIALEGGTGFVAAADVAPGPLALLQEDILNFTSYADCDMFVDRRPLERRELAIVRGGQAYQDIEVLLYKPATDTALEISQVFEGEFSGSGKPYIGQAYSSADYFPTGVYIVELTWNGRTFRYGFDAQDNALYLIQFYCDPPSSE